MNPSLNIIITSLQSWDIPIGSNAIDIATEISKNNRVLYVNSPNDHITSIKKYGLVKFFKSLFTRNNYTKSLRKISNSLYIIDLPFSVWPVNKLPDGIVFDFFNKLNNKKIFSFVKKTASKLNFDKYIHFIDNDIYRSYFAKNILNPELSIYYRRDNLLGFNYWKGHAKRLEPNLISKSDLVVCNSPELNNFAQKHNTNSYFIGQGVDLTSYDPVAQIAPPKNISGITGPRIGYIGDITSLRLDAELIYNLAISRPTYSFIMIGPEDKHFQTHKIHHLKNVHFVGRVPKNMVPNYIAAMDVCMNPQLLNEITIGNYPRKVDEYLAMGKPVVATKTDTMSIFKDHVYCCSSLEEYTHSIDTAITDQNESNFKKRIEFAQTHSWANNVNYLLTLINNNLKLNENVL